MAAKDMPQRRSGRRGRPGRGHVRGRRLRAHGAWVVACVAGLVGAACPSASRAEDDRVESSEDAAAGVARDANLVDLGANFDANVFDQRGDGWMLRGNVVRRRVPGQPTPAVEPGESPTISRGRRVGAARLDRIARICTLADQQRRALELAIESDVRELAAAIDAERRRYAGVTVNMSDQEGQRRWHQFQQDVQRCRRRIEELFESGSLFAGVLALTLDDTQRERLDTEIASRRSFLWSTMVATVLLKVDDAVGLDAEQHRLVEEALLAREPRLRLDESARRSNAHAEQMLVYSTLADVDAAPLQAALSERQWRALATLMNQGRAMRSWLEQQGLVERPAEAP